MISRLRDVFTGLLWNSSRRLVYLQYAMTGADLHSGATASDGFWLMGSPVHADRFPRGLNTGIHTGGLLLRAGDCRLVAIFTDGDRGGHERGAQGNANLLRNFMVALPFQIAQLQHLPMLLGQRVERMHEFLLTHGFIVCFTWAGIPGKQSYFIQ